MKRRVVGIFGTGLIGGSIGMRARRDGALVVGHDVSPGMLAQALEVGAIDLAATRDELYARAGTVVIAAPPEATMAEVQRLRSGAAPRATLIVDVASVKAPVVEAANGMKAFVATHPIAGSERSGVRAARADLFERRTWAYVPTGDTRLDARARAFITSLGAAAFAVDAHEHDRIVALTSHLVQVVASCFSARARERDGETVYQLSGTAARELLRLGESPAGLWCEIFAANAANVEPELRALAAALLSTADALRARSV